MISKPKGAGPSVPTPEVEAAEIMLLVFVRNTLAASGCFSSA